MGNKSYFWRVFYLVMVGGVLLPTLALADTTLELDTTPAQFSVTYESVNLPDDENMGLVGGTFLYETNEWLSVGGGSYGAVNGKRGGFITLGGAAEIHKRLSDTVELKSGLFVGAGGGRGGFALQGGGLMLRYHIGAELQTEQWGKFGAGMSYLDFPDGAIHSLQPYISYNYPFRTLIPSGWIIQQPKNSSGWGGLRDAEQEFALVYRYYAIPTGVVTDSGRPQNDQLGLMGAEWLRYLDDNFFFKFESEGAMQGVNNGYMQIFMGGGYRYQLAQRSWLKFSGLLGVAGGGSVDTGGGLLLDGQVSFQQKLTDHIFAELGGGYVIAPDASFESATIAMKLGYHFYTPDIPVYRERVALSDVSSFGSDNFRIRITQQTYLQDSDNWRNHHVDQNVSLLGFQVDYFMAQNFYLTGQGISAYGGMAGGYMTGLVGGGLHFPLFNTSLSLEAEVLAGAAGGGGLDVSGGFVWQGNAGLGYKISESFSALGTYGYMSAPDGNFQARVVSLSLAHHFSLFTK